MTATDSGANDSMILHQVAARAARAGRLAFLAAAFGAAALPPAQAQTTPAVSTVLALSGSTLGDGVIRGPDGALYGASATTASDAGGLVFRVTPDGSAVATIYQLGENDGISPQGALLLDRDDRFFYGTTQFSKSGPTSGAGTVFRVAVDGTGFTTLHDFAPSTSNNRDGNPINTNGALPNGALIEGSDGLLYGVTRAGGPAGTGAVYKIGRDGSGFALLHTFAAITSGTGSTVTTDGAYPRAALTEFAGFFYGTTASGGANGQGTIYRLRFDGSEFTVVHAFTTPTVPSGSTAAVNEDGAGPVAGLTDGGDGLLYGVTTRGGANGSGTLYSLSPDGTVLTLHDFALANGAAPQGTLLLASDGKFYGTTFGGGTTSSGANSALGTIYSFDPGGTGFAKLHSFDGTNGSNGIGMLVQLSATDFAGTAANGGACGSGTIFRLGLNGSTVDGDDSCGNTDTSSDGGGAVTPALAVALGVLLLAHRLRRRRAS